MTDFDERDFENLMLKDIYYLTDKEDIFKKYPILTRYKEFTKTPLGLNKVLKYISFVYDSQSPLISVITNLARRKREGALLAGFDVNKYDEFPESVQKMLSCQTTETNAMIMRYIRMQKNPDFSQLVVFEESYNKQLEKLLSDDADQSEKTKDLIANVSTLKKEISKLMIELLNKDENKNLMDELYNTVEEEQLLIRPELIADSMREGNTMKDYLDENKG